MGKKKTTRVETVESDAPDEGAELLETGTLPNDDAALDAAAAALDELRELGGDEVIQWTVFKVSSGPGGKGGYCGRFSSGDLSLDMIRDTWGGGKYRIRGTDQARKWVTGASRTVELMDMPKAAGATPAPITPPQDFQGLAAILAAVKPSGDANAQMMTLLTAIVNRPPPPAPPQMGIGEILALIKEMRPESKGKDSTELLMEGIRLGRDLAGGGGETGLMDIAARGLDMIAPIVKAQALAPKAAPRIAAPAPALVLPAGAPETVAPGGPRSAAPAVPTAQPKEVDPMFEKLKWLRHQVRILIHQAARGGDPELYAAVLLDNLPDFITEEEMLERMSAPDAITQLAMLEPAVNTHAAWFEEFRQAVLGQFENDDDSPDGEGAPPSGDMGEGGVT